MRPEDMRRHGTALAERVRREVYTSERLDVILRRHRRQRAVAFAAAAAAVIALVVGVVLVFSTEESPVVTEPPPTTVPSGLQSLQVEVFIVLVGDYTVDTADDTCEGSGPLADLRSGSLVHVWDESAYPSPEEAPAIALPEGMEVASNEEGASYLLSAGENTGCVFALPGLEHDISEYAHISLLPESDPDVAISSRIIGQRVVVTFGVERGKPGFDLGSGVNSDVPEEWQAELQALWESAGPRRIVGSVALWEGSSLCSRLVTALLCWGGAVRGDSTGTICGGDRRRRGHCWRDHPAWIRLRRSRGVAFCGSVSMFPPTSPSTRSR